MSSDLICWSLLLCSTVWHHFHWLSRSQWGEVDNNLMGWLTVFGRWLQRCLVSVMNMDHLSICSFSYDPADFLFFFFLSYDTCNKFVTLHHEMSRNVPIYFCSSMDFAAGVWKCRFWDFSCNCLRNHLSLVCNMDIAHFPVFHGQKHDFFKPHPIALT